MIGSAFALAAVLAGSTLEPARRTVELRYNVYVGDATRPATAGIIWLLRYSWYGDVQARIGSIREGTATIAFLIDAMPRLVHPDGAYDDNYVIAFELSGAQWYLSRPIDSNRFFADLPAAVETIGTVVEGGHGASRALGLAPSAVRTVALLNEDGTPAKRLRLYINVHVSRHDHCFREQGPVLGNFTTDEKGAVSLRAPPVPLFIGAEYYRDIRGKYYLEFGIIVGKSRNIALRRTWSLPDQRVALTVNDGLGRPAAGRWVEVQPRTSMCGAWSGGVGATDSHGVARLTLRHLAIDQIWVDLPGGRRRYLTPLGRALLALLQKGCGRP